MFGQSKQIIELESRIAALEETETINQNRIADLEETKTINQNRMVKLEKKFKMMEKCKVIGDLLDPLVKVGDESEVTIIFPHIIIFFMSF